MPTLITPAAAGLPVTATSASADATGNYIIPSNGVDVVVRINNGSGASINVTLDDPNTTVPEGSSATGSTYPDVVAAIPAGAARTFVFTQARRTRFVDTTTGRINWTYSAATSVTVEAVAVY